MHHVISEEINRGLYACQSEENDEKYSHSVSAYRCFPLHSEEIITYMHAHNKEWGVYLF